MDLEDWELLPRHDYMGLDLDHETTKKMITNTGKAFDMDYFICPTQDPVQKTELQVPVTWEPVSTVDDTDPDQDPEPLTDSVPLTFETTKENQFVDMKTDLQSPLPDEKHSKSEGGLGGEHYDEMRSEGDDLRSKKEVDWDEDVNINGERMNLWKKGLNGIGAICSFGVAAAAATICVFFLGHNNNIQGCRNKNQILRFQIYSDDNQGMKEVVKHHHATKLNEVISVMKSLPVARAQISFGGYYDSL